MQFPEPPPSLSMSEDRKTLNVRITEQAYESLLSLSEAMGGCSVTGLAESILDVSTPGLFSAFEIALHERESKGLHMPKVRSKLSKGVHRKYLQDYVRTLSRYESAVASALESDSKSDVYVEGNYV